ncbi:MAG: hypothetical protein COV75_02620 [Candidatus Omnitrophica bacterium CG11_big_fil_rev_8_21_14_0_20_63_9]|nr:MAG: hypothetical protein COV75_02620 [Candidatus Omnitrophica bacterium CG11_big_fil_rev_8_21_14_0_20_63_9]
MSASRLAEGKHTPSLALGPSEHSPGELTALFVADRPGAMELPILSEPEIAEVVRQLRRRLLRRQRVQSRA